MNAAAKHDPVNGIWSRVCEKCYKGREGYSDTQGVSLRWLLIETNIDSSGFRSDAGLDRRVQHCPKDPIGTHST